MTSDKRDNFSLFITSFFFRTVMRNAYVYIRVYIENLVMLSQLSQNRWKKSLLLFRKGSEKYMDAKEFLSRAYLLELQIQTMMQQIEKLRALASRVSGGIRKDVVKHDRKTTGMEDTVLKIVEEEEKLTLKIDELVNTKREIREVLDRVEDQSQRLILEKRYLLFQDWETIRIDFDHVRSWTIYKHRAALESVQKILDEREKGECVV